MLLAVGLALMASAARDHPALAETTRLPVPSAHAQAVARAQIQREFVQTFHTLNSSTALEFSNALMRKYSHGKHDPARQYVALTIAMHLYAKIGAWWYFPGPAKVLSQDFMVDPGQARLRAARDLYASLTASRDRGRMNMAAGQAFQWATKSMDGGDYRAVPGLLLIARDYYQHLGDGYNLGRVRKLQSRAALIIPALRQRRIDQSLLKANPNYPPALLRMALFHWLVSAKPEAQAKGNAEAKRSGSAALAEIMKLSVQNSPNARRLIRLGNLWWNLPKTHKLLAYTPLVQRHAIKIYCQAIPGVSRAFSAMIGQGDYHASVLFIGQAKKAAKRTRDPKMLSIAHQWNSMLRQAHMLHRRYAAAIKTIAKRADDPAANQTIGEYLCFLGSRWKSGLVYLKLAGLPGLRRTAKMDLTDPTTPAAQLALGNRWWILARSYRGIMRSNIELRATYWYALALEKLPAGAYKDLRYRVAKLQAGSR